MRMKWLGAGWENYASNRFIQIRNSFIQRQINILLILHCGGSRVGQTFCPRIVGITYQAHELIDNPCSCRVFCTMLGNQSLCLSNLSVIVSLSSSCVGCLRAQIVQAVVAEAEGIGTSRSTVLEGLQTKLEGFCIRAILHIDDRVLHRCLCHL